MTKNRHEKAEIEKIRQIREFYLDEMRDHRKKSYSGHAYREFTNELEEGLIYDKNIEIVK